MRRVIFDVEKDADDKLNLVMTQYPLLAIPNDQHPPKSIVLARDVSAFVLEFWSPKEDDWLADFLQDQRSPADDPNHAGHRPFAARRQRFPSR